ncbi:hypothetical protein CEXT_218231 [Caerostris extrusa]|uniref:Uncharacterized protein n=1 Tax=Caerostris extrusa TaxID=172846 RepID=A0AAV4TZA4_CAEEX|nr:hypothetical protein CEXT_218231 [Caerostris extrusa]
MASIFPHTNLNKLEVVQHSAARIVTGLRHSCPNDIVLFESDLPLLSMKRTYCLTKILTSFTATMNSIEFPPTFTLGLTIDV